MSGPKTDPATGSSHPAPPQASSSAALEPSASADTPTPAAAEEPGLTSATETPGPNAAEATETSAPLAALQEPETETTDTSSSAGDSALDINSEYDPSVYTASLTSSITSYRYEHGRRYHAYQDGRYDLPNDEQEQERLDLQYHALRLAYGDNLYFAPIGPKPGKILDLGTGTGIWAIDVAEALPDTEIIGTDLSPIQPRWVPPNVKFEVDDVEQPWTFPANHFDMVHTRIMNAFIQDWYKLMEQAFHHLKPGGWMESQELSVEVRTDDDSLPADSYIQKWCEVEEEAWRKGFNLSVILTGEMLQDYMEKAGFVNITIRRFKIPIGQWPADPKLRETGAFQLVAMLEGLQALTIAPWVRHRGWMEDEVEVFISNVRKEWKNRKIHSYFPLFAVYGQKPEA